MAKKISPTQQSVLDKLRETGQNLERRTGGFWTYRGCPEKSSHGGLMVPVWYVTVQTVRALERDGWLVRTNTHPEEWRDERTLAGCLI